LKLIRPYTRIELAFIAKELNIPVADVESLLVLLILDEEIVGFIDQEQGTLELHHHHTNQERHDAVSKWSEELGHLLTAIESKLI
jgi:COP9 signalosome complex subunit 2